MLEPYQVEIVRATVQSASGDAEAGFTLDADGQRYQSRASVLADGLVDHLPLIPGLSELWGTQVVACPHCHGWEVRGEALAQVAFPDDPAQGITRATAVALERPGHPICQPGS